MLSAKTLGTLTHIAVKKVHVHEMLGSIIIVAHASEILRVVREVQVWHILLAALLFALWLMPEKQKSELA